MPLKYKNLNINQKICNPKKSEILYFSLKVILRRLFLDFSRQDKIFYTSLLTLFKMGGVLDIDTCEHGDSPEGQHLIQLDHGKLDLKF